MSTQGGQYEILRIIHENLERDTFTAKELCKYFDLCHQSIINNLSRLVKLGILERYEEKIQIKNKQGRRFTYRISEDAINLLNNLYD